MHGAPHLESGASCFLLEEGWRKCLRSRMRLPLRSLMVYHICSKLIRLKSELSRVLELLHTHIMPFLSAVFRW